MIPHAIEPNAKPGGLVFVHYIDEKVVLRQEVGPSYDTSNAALAATFAKEQVDQFVRHGHVVYLYIYDGDTGLLNSKAVADRNGRRRL